MANIFPNEITEPTLQAGGHCEKRNVEKGILERYVKGDGFQKDERAKATLIITEYRSFISLFKFILTHFLFLVQL